MNGLRLKVGQLWQVNGVVYRIDTLKGPDWCYPIEMSEVSRDPSIDDAIRSVAKALPEVHRRQHLRALEKRTMKQERAWFNRTDVKVIEPSAVLSKCKLQKGKPAK
jgi:hypothetical protein